MLKALELENFKAFGERTRIELAPITLIFGENSAGKSSILQALNLLKQTRDNRDSGALLLPRTERGITELGGFKEFVFDHNLSNKLRIRLDFELDPAAHQSSKTASGNGNAETAGFEMAFQRHSLEQEVELDSLQFFSSESVDGVATFKPAEVSSKEKKRLFAESRMLWRSLRFPHQSSIRFAKCVDVSKDVVLWADFFDRTKRRSPRIVEELTELQSEAIEPDGQKYLFDDGSDGDQDLFQRIDESIVFYRSDFSIDEFIERMCRGERETIIGLDGFIPLATRQRNRGGLPELETFRRYGPTRLRTRELTLDLNHYTSGRGRIVEQILESIYPMGPFRRPPERWYIFAGTSPHDVGYHGELLPDLLFRNPKVVEETNSWLDKLEVGYHLKLQSASDRSRDLFEVRLVDRRRSSEVDVALSDVGYGVSQILPFIVQSLAGEKQIITIEQPEVHIHPRLQADLGDLLASCIGESRNHRFIIETHSEHLVLRMQKLIRDGKLPPNDVSILYVKRGPNGSTVERLNLDEEGDFVDDWPGGFFPERLRELT